MTDPSPPAAAHHADGRRSDGEPAADPDSDPDPTDLGCCPDWSNIGVDDYDDEQAVAAIYLAVLDQTTRLAGDLAGGELHRAYVNAAVLHAAAADLVVHLERGHVRPGVDGEPVWHDDGLHADRIRSLVAGHAQRCPVGCVLHPRTTAPTNTPDACPDDRT